MRIFSKQSPIPWFFWVHRWNVAGATKCYRKSNAKFDRYYNEEVITKVLQSVITQKMKFPIKDFILFYFILFSQIIWQISRKLLNRSHFNEEILWIRFTLQKTFYFLQWQPFKSDEKWFLFHPKSYFHSWGWFRNLWRQNLVNKKLQYIYCSISNELKTIRQWSLIS